MERLAAAAAARVTGGPITIARPGSALRQAVRIHGRSGTRAALCELDGAGIRITDDRRRLEIAWRDVRSVVAERGRVRLVSPREIVTLSLSLDGVAEPGLSPFFAQVVSDGRRGTLTAEGSLHELARAIDETVDGFADGDDPVVPLAVGGLAVMAGIILLAAIPYALELAARITPAPGAFVLLPRVSGADPRVIAASVAGGSAIAALVARMALGAGAAAWARGTVRGWHRNAAGIEDRVRRAVAWSVLSPWPLLAATALALGLAVPAAFARTVIDAAGIHAASGFPLLSTEVGWSAVTDVVPVTVGFSERPEGFVTELVLADGSRVSTRGRDLIGGSERSLYDFSRARAR